MVNTQIIPVMFTIKEVTAKLKISRPTLDRLRKDGKINALVFGDNVRFTEQEIERFINASSENQPS